MAVDEFLFFDRADSAVAFMPCYEEYVGGLSWRMYNANGHIRAPKGSPTMECYTREFDYFEPRIKVSGMLKYGQTFPTAHHFILLKGSPVATDNSPIHRMSEKYCSYINGHSKHSLTKSREDWVKRLKRGNITRGLRKEETFFRV